MGSTLSKQKPPCFSETEEQQNNLVSTFDVLPSGSYNYAQIISVDEEKMTAKLGTFYFKNNLWVFCPIEHLTVKWSDIEFVKLDHDTIMMTFYMHNGKQVQIEFENTLFRSTKYAKFRSEVIELNIFGRLRGRAEEVLGLRSYELLYQSFELLGRKMPTYFVIRSAVPKLGQRKKEFLDEIYKKVIDDQIQDAEDNFLNMREYLQENPLARVTIECTTSDAKLLEAYELRTAWQRLLKQRMKKEQKI